MDIRKTVERLLEAKETYYTGTPIMSDKEFDELEDQLRKADPNNEYFSIVGSSVSEKKIKHVIPMLSMNKVKTVKEAEKWFNHLNIESIIVIEPKIDGASGEIVYSNGKLEYIATRGDGGEGRDITHVAKYISSIPKTINTKGITCVRGEFYFPKNNPIVKSKLRNNASGILNRKEDLENLKYLKFIAYQLFGLAQKYVCESLEDLKDMGFNTVYHTNIQISCLEDHYKEYIEKLRNEWEYETDGLILTINDISLHEEIDSRWKVEHHHHYAMALKPPSEGKETTLKGIDWGVTRYGSIIPVAVLEPIEVGGVEISRAALNNYQYLLDLKLNYGDTLYIERANDVIPHVSENRTAEVRSRITLKHCPSCNSELVRKGIHLKCVSPHCSEQRIQQIIFWCSRAEIEGVKEGTVRKLYDAKAIHSIRDLYFLSINDFAKVPGFGIKSATSVLEEIKKSRTVTATKFIERLGIPMVGEKAIINMGIKSINDFIKFNDKAYRVGEEIVEWKKDNMEQFKGLLDEMDIIEPNKVVNKSAKGKVCMTGAGPKTRKELIKNIEDKGYEFVDHVSSDTDILICEDINGSSGKLQKAKKQGTKLISYDEFFR